MSKNKSLKGYVFGALVALVSTTFSVAPAMADAIGPVTLLPTSGTTFNTIIGSPISFSSTQDRSTDAVDASNSATSSFYVIENPDEAEIQIQLSGSPSSFSFITYDANGDSAQTLNGGTTVAGVLTSSIAAGYLLKTSLSKIAVSAATGVAGAVTLNPFSIDSSVKTKTVNLTVQTLVDTNRGSATTLGYANGFDRVSKKEAVVLYALGDVPATTTIVSLVPGFASFSATVVYGNNVNPFFVNATTSVALYAGGVPVNFTDGLNPDLDTSATSTVTAPDRLKTNISTTKTVSFTAADTIFAGVSASDAALFDAIEGAATFSPGIYSAQAYYGLNTVGATSMAWDVTAGASDRVTSISPSVVNTVEAKFDSTATTKEVSLKSGTKAVTINGQISTTTESLAISNIEVKAEISEEALAAGTTITSTGTLASLVKDGPMITAYARTNGLGKVSFTITSTTGKKADALSVVLFAKKSDGTWSVMGGLSNLVAIDVVWEDATETPTFTAKPANYVSGANPTVTFEIADQFGGAMNAVNGKALTVYAVASFGGVEAPLTYSSTVNVSGGEAVFTFANFAKAGSLAQLQATLFTGGLADSTKIGASVIVNVYNTAATSTVNIATSFKTAVSYVDYVTGDTAVAAVAAAVSDAGLSTSEGVAITGNVLNASGVGQPGVAVTVALDGVLFYDAGVYSLGSVTTNANEFGAFSVTAIAHTVYERGATVTVTADGQTSTTLLITHLPSGMVDENLSFGWTLPAQVVKNTTYAVTLQLSDKWGNPVAGTTTSTVGAVSIQGVGSVEVNSVATPVLRNFDKNGQATVFLRSVKDIAGPGAISATLTTVFNYPGADGTSVASATIGTFNTTDAKSTVWDESLWENSITSNVEVLDVATAASADTKVNVGTFKGYVALYAKGYEGQRMSAIVAGKWIEVASLDSDFVRVVRFTGAGYDIDVKIYIDGKQVGSMFKILTK
jgi:hypothetical protein